MEKIFPTVLMALDFLAAVPYAVILRMMQFVQDEMEEA